MPKTTHLIIGSMIFASLIGVVVSVILVQQNQNLQRRAASASACEHSPDCDVLDNPGNRGNHTASRPILFVDITAQDYHRYAQTDTNDGCYHVTISGSQLGWERVGSGPDCKDISNIQIWHQATPPPQDSPTPTPATPISPTPPPDSPEQSRPPKKHHQTNACQQRAFTLSSQSTPTPTPPPGSTATPTPPPGATSTPTSTPTPNPTSPPGSTSTPTPPSAATSTPTNTPAPGQQSTATPTPLIVAEQPNLPQVGTSVPTIVIATLGFFIMATAILFII